MTDQKPPELFAERPVSSDFAGGGGPSYAVRRLITVFVLAALIGGGLYWAFGKRGPAAPGEIPTIKAEAGPYKQRPDNPGGIDIPHQDVQVYQSLDPNTPAQPQVEHLLPPPEIPLAPPPTPPKPVLTTATQDQPIESIPAKDALGEAPNAPSVAPPPVAAPAVAPVPAPKAVVTAAAPATKTKSAPTKAPQQTMNQVIEHVTGGQAAAKGTAIQLASIPDQAAAQSAMRNLQKKYASILGTNQLRLVKADLAKGVFYRIQTAPLSDDQAKSLCASLKDAKAGCILVRN